MIRYNKEGPLTHNYHCSSLWPSESLAQLNNIPKGLRLSESLLTDHWLRPWVQWPLQNTGGREGLLRVLAATNIPLFVLLILSWLHHPLKITAESGLLLSTPVFWSWVRTPYQIAPCGIPAHGIGKNKGDRHHTVLFIEELDVLSNNWTESWLSQNATWHLQLSWWLVWVFVWGQLVLIFGSTQRLAGHRLSNV